MQINALCMAFYARSEEARQSHSAHKLALVGVNLVAISLYMLLDVTFNLSLHLAYQLLLT